MNPKHNLRTFDNYAPIYFQSDPNFNSEDLKLVLPEVSTSKSLYFIKNVLTSIECQHLINSSRLHYQSLEHEFSKDEREANRVLTNDTQFASVLYSRIERFLSNDPKLSSLRPCGFGTSGTWIPHKINSCFRYNQYVGPSIGFVPHRDATYIEDENSRSILTLLIYLNDDFQKGETIFLKSHNRRNKNQLVSDELENGFHERYRFEPKTGSILIFNHNIIHLGDEILPGDIKYLIRTDLVFKRVEKVEDYSWRTSPDFIQSVKLYREAFNQELDGNITAASLLYQRALTLRQCYKD